MWDKTILSQAEDRDSLYHILGVSILASEEEIKCAWKRKAFKLHPDRQNGDPEATKQFQSVANAYEVLRDRTLRAEYDKELLHRLYLEEYLRRFADLILTASGLGLPLERDSEIFAQMPPRAIESLPLWRPWAVS